MIETDSSDHIHVALAAVTPLRLNEVRADAVRDRCRSQLACRAAGARRRNVASATWMTVAGPVLLALFAALYAAALVSTALQLER